MTDFTTASPRLRARNRAEGRYQWYGRIAILISLGFLAVMVTSIFWQAKGAFFTTEIALTVDLTEVDAADLKATSFDKLYKSSLRDSFPDVTKRKQKKKLYGLVSVDAGFHIREAVAENPSLAGGVHTIWVTASDDLDLFVKGKVDRDLPEDSRRIKDDEIAWIDALENEGKIRHRVNWGFLTSGDSREPELAGIMSALVGSSMAMLVCLSLSFPIGVMSAIYLEEFAPKNRFSDIIEININNLAAVPSIVFGLLGLYLFLGADNWLFGPDGLITLPRSSPRVGGLVLALMTLPTIIIASRASLRAVPPSIREAALGMGASPVQSTFHHVVPLALPGMFTGAIVGMARALGETAPLLMIGMVAFIVDVPQSFVEPATALPVQIFLWADAPQRAFVEKTSAAIVVLLVFLIAMNLLAILLRRKFEKRF